MPEQVFKIDSVDFTSFLQSDGLKWSRNDIDGPNAGRDMNGTMRRGRVAVKSKLKLTCRPLNHTEMAALNASLNHETIEVTYLDPIRGLYTGEFYGSSVDGTTAMTFGGDVLWTGTTFSLIEV